jgi:hypothetical protein
MSSFDDQPYDPFNTQTGSGNSFATRPGMVRLSQERLQRMHPYLYEVKARFPWQKSHKPSTNHEIFKVHVAEHLRYGLAEPALVIQLGPLVIATYCHELDAVVHLGFYSCGSSPKGRKYPTKLAEELIERYNLRVGSRLLSVNTFYGLNEGPYACDIIPGPQARGVYGNISPYIAEFLTSDLAEVEERKKEIEGWEWQKCQQLAEQYRQHVVGHEPKPRDGRPLGSLSGTPQDWLPGRQPLHLRK